MIKIVFTLAPERRRKQKANAFN